jgi:hypothetical protein
MSSPSAGRIPTLYQAGGTRSTGAETMDEQYRQMLQETAAGALVMRDVLARLLAYEALRHPDQRKFFEDFSVTTANRIKIAGEGATTDATIMSFQETLQLAIDDLLSSARGIATVLQGPEHP